MARSLGRLMPWSGSSSSRLRGSMTILANVERKEGGMRARCGNVLCQSCPAASVSRRGNAQPYSASYRGGCFS